jgi:hypothetical protein
LAILIDTAAPAIQVAPLPPPNSAGWYDHAVTARYTAADALAGLASPASGSFTFGADGAGQVHTFTVNDVAGNSASVTVGPVNIDRTAPTVTADVTPAVLTAGSGTQVVTVTGQIADALSGVASATYSVRDSYKQLNPSGSITIGPGGSYSFTLTLDATLNAKQLGRIYRISVQATDKAGNTRTVEVTVLVPGTRGHKLSPNDQQDD